MALSTIEKDLLDKVAGIHEIPEGAYNIRLNGEAFARASDEAIDIVPKADKPGIDILIRPGTKNKSVHIPVLLTKTGLKELVYNDFHIGEDADVTIVAGCGIHNGGKESAEHSGIHSFFVGKNAKVKYIEKHYGTGDGNGERVMNPQSVIVLDENAYMEMDTCQIGGVDSTKRKTVATLKEGATLVVGEKIMTHGSQTAETDFSLDLIGEGAAAHVVSRSVAKDRSRQVFLSEVKGNAPCSGHTECDAIIMDDAQVSAIPKVCANHPDASLIHEAAIGKIAGEPRIKLMTLGLTEKEAEDTIINGFLK